MTAARTDRQIQSRMNDGQISRPSYLLPVEYHGAGPLRHGQQHEQAVHGLKGLDGEDL